MTVRQRLAAARRVVTAGVTVRLLLAGGAAAAATVVVAGLVDSALAMPVGTRAAVPWLAAAVALIVITPIAWRARRVTSDQALALWIEEREPLDYLLVTASDPAVGDQPAVTTALDQTDFLPAVRRAALQGTRDSALFAAGVVAILAVIPDASIRRVLAPRAGDVLLHSSSARASRLHPLVARYTPPGYIGGDAVTLENPESVRGIEGGLVEVMGHGSSVGIDARVGTATLIGSSDGALWQFRTTMPRSATVLRLADGADTRLIALEPIRDSLPTVGLIAPARDTVVRTAGGRMGLSAVLTDDFGLAEGWFEYVVSSGAGELFQFRSGRIDGRTVGRSDGRRSDSIQGALDLDSLRLRPGDVLHVRAVARDLGPTSRGLGASETRTYRVARPTDLDTASVIALPSLPGDTAGLSQRLLIQLTEALEARRPRLRREVVQDEARAISRDQRRLRRQVADVIFLRLTGETTAEEVEGVEADSALTPEALLAAAEAATGQGDTAALDFAEGESPVVAINRPLLEAYNAMWDASRELDHAALSGALPHMYIALDAIQRARAAERVYLRAPAQRAVVNLAQVRLTGRRDGIVVQGRIGGWADRRIEWLDRVLREAGGWADGRVSGQELRDSLLVLRIEILPEIPAAAAALNDATAALRQGSDPSPGLNAARQALSAYPPVRPSASPRTISPWAGAW